MYKSVHFPSHIKPSQQSLLDKNIKPGQLTQEHNS